jgi:hypothetical protein
MTDPIPASEIEAIRTRYEDDARDGVSPGSAFWQGHLDVGSLLRALDAATEENARINPEFIAAVIRRVDGNNKLGAGQLADFIVDALKETGQ